jgi:hypothetical protein
MVRNRNRKKRRTSAKKRIGFKNTLRTNPAFLYLACVLLFAAIAFALIMLLGDEVSHH